MASWPAHWLSLWPASLVFHTGQGAHLKVTIAKFASFSETFAARMESKDGLGQIMMIRNSSRLFALWALSVAASLVPKAWAQEPDPKYRSPRATVRTLYIAADLAQEDPRHIEHAIGCLELSGRRAGTQFGGMIAD